MVIKHSEGKNLFTPEKSKFKKFIFTIFIIIILIPVVGLASILLFPSILAPKNPVSEIDPNFSQQTARDVKDRFNNAIESIKQNPSSKINVTLNSEEINALLNSTLASSGTKSSFNLQEGKIEGSVELPISGRPVGVDLALTPLAKEGYMILKVDEVSAGKIPLPAGVAMDILESQAPVNDAVRFNSDKKMIIINPSLLVKEKDPSINIVLDSITSSEDKIDIVLASK